MPSWMMPTVVEKPSSRARCAMVSASAGFRTPAPTTELTVTSNSASLASHRSFWSSTFRLFTDTSSGSTLSMLICRWSRPARFSRRIRSRVSRYPFVISVAMAPRRRMWRDDRVEVGMEQRLAAADRDDASAQSCKAVDAPEDLVCRHRRRVVVVLVAVAARQVTAPDRNQMGVDGLVLEPERPDQHPGFAESPVRLANTPR